MIFFCLHVRATLLFFSKTKHTLLRNKVCPHPHSHSTLLLLNFFIYFPERTKPKGLERFISARGGASWETLSPGMGVGGELDSWLCRFDQ